MVKDSLSEVNRKTLLKFQWVLMFLRWFLFPFTAYVLPLLSSSIRKRLDFECQNAKDPLSRGWSDNIKADLAFEVSSEGEFEQAFPLIKVSLELNQRVEVFYASESLEKKIQNVPVKHEKQMLPTTHLHLSSLFTFYAYFFLFCFIFFPLFIKMFTLLMANFLLFQFFSPFKNFFSPFVFYFLCLG